MLQNCVGAQVQVAAVATLAVMSSIATIGRTCRIMCCP
jgi:hypothetical protein